MVRLGGQIAGVNHARGDKPRLRRESHGCGARQSSPFVIYAYYVEMEPLMQSYSIVDLVRNIRDVTLAASKAPITLTQHRKARYVLMTKEDFEQLSAKAHDPRKAYLTGDMPTESIALFLDGLQPQPDHAD